MVEPQTSLRRHPNIAQQVGLVVADYAVLEARMYLIYASVSPRTGAESFKAFFGLRNINKRQELVLGELTPILSADKVRALKRLWKRFKSAASRRTEIAHCTFLDSNDTPMRLRLVGTTPHIEKLDQAIFDRTFIQYRNLSQDMQNFLRFACDIQVATLEKLQSSPLGPLLRLGEQKVEALRDREQPKVSELEASMRRLDLYHLLPQPKGILRIQLEPIR